MKEIGCECDLCLEWTPVSDIFILLDGSIWCSRCYNKTTETIPLENRGKYSILKVVKLSNGVRRSPKGSAMIYTAKRVWGLRWGIIPWLYYEVKQKAKD